jgi:uncharacterized protein
MGAFKRVDSDFLSRGEKCGGWLYLPTEVKSDAPVVIMAHGFAAERTFRLPAFAERFAERGIAVFLFDFRNIGSSEGVPRNLVSITRQLQDWKAAITHVCSLPLIDRHKVALWGSSYSGGEVITIAAGDPRIAAIIAQVPNIDPISSSFRMGIRSFLPAFPALLRDFFRMVTRRKPYFVPVVGDPGMAAVMNTPEAKDGYLSMIPEGSTWKNETPARSMLGSLFCQPPIISANKVRCPALIIVAEGDSLISPRALKKTASRIQRATTARFPVGHFGVYSGETFEKVVQIEADFLVTHLMNQL